MPTERFHRIQELFESARELAEAQRPDFLRESCAGDADLAAEVASLLDYEARLAAKHTRNPLASALDSLASQSSSAMAGSRVGRYELFEEIGSGGMGRVFRARRRDGDVEQWVALKLMRRERVRESLTQRFSHERRILANLQHAGIAHFIDAGTDDDGTPYVAMELVEGASIVRHCAQHRLALRERLLLFRQVLAAVSHAHRMLVVHRDIKPSNVLVTPQGEAKLLDFGIAKLLSGEGENTRTDDRAFSPASAAPEQLVGGLVDVTTDVYGLGALLYELIAGAPPFRVVGLSAADLEHQIRHVPPRSLEATRRAERAPVTSASDADEGAGVEVEVSRDLENIVQKALRKEPAGRYPSVEQFDADVDRFLQHRPVLASGAGKIYRLRKFVRRQRWPVAFSALALIAAVSVATLIARQNRVIRAERDRAQAALSVMKDAFKGADPSGLAGGSATAQQILDSSIRAIEPLVETHPEDFLALAPDLVEVQLSLGLVEPASELLAKVAEMKALAGGDPALRTRTDLLAAKIAIERNRYDEAERLIAGSLVQRPEMAGKVGYLRGVIALRRREYAVAVDAFRSAIAAEPASARNGDWVQAHLLLAESLAREKRFDEAESALRVLMSSVEGELGAEHVQALRVQLARLAVLQSAGQTERMRTEGLALLDKLTRSYGHASTLTALAEVSVASAFIANLDYAEAAEHMRRAADGFEQSLGAEHPRSFRTRFNVGTLLSRVPGRTTEADAEYKLALGNAERGLPVTDPTLGFFRLEYAEYLLRNDQPIPALTVLVSDLQRVTQANLSVADRTDAGQVLGSAYTGAGCVASKPDKPAPDAALICADTSPVAEHCRAARALACALAAPAAQ